jgi:purine-nucleoside/S-methyl-5'-thioadenosine phosphorylase / adenosine deaminase
MSQAPVQFFPALSALPGIRHGFTLRVPGLDVRTDRQRALARLENYHSEARAEFGPRRFYTAEQIHGGRVAVVGRDSAPEAQGVDGLITQDPGGLLGISVADCCAIFLVDTQRPAIGLVHSGRKGTELNVAGAAVCQMSEQFGTDPADLVVQLSPCIRPPYYDVDFAAEIQRQLRAAGVKQVFDTGENTGADLDRFYSYRVEKGRTGRMLALLTLATA